jgi:D-amino peptidase
MRAIVMTDLEGVAGVVSFAEHTYAGAPYGEKAKHLLTGEVNACAEGLLEAGATDVLVIDGHGPGGILFEEIHPEVRLVHGRPLSPEWKGLLEESDVALFVGQHAMAGVPDGNLNHTQNSRAVTSYTLNGRPIGEIAQFALFAGSYGVPVIFLSGDEAACREIRELIPGVTAVAVKKGLGRNSAVCLSAAKARSLIREGARTALESHRSTPLTALQWPGPYVLEKRYFSTDLTEQYRHAASFDPRIQILDPLTVRIRRDSLREIIWA